MDWDYNRHDRSNIFRPWGYQIGHQTEWAKLLILLERERPLPPRFATAFEIMRDAPLGAAAFEADHLVGVVTRAHLHARRADRQRRRAWRLPCELTKYLAFAFLMSKPAPQPTRTIAAQ